ncbi:aminopeptidase [Schleiferilactobacillus shenzhenensis]|uniref:PepS n=1 Tax=Schleiferilactobacillus shenzhenensis LY-73 TaxID=1231336 RepID=U4TRK4_9LACO|nr:aminopeptidase [Schleiferilactobacillus shenzhenensis]ERL66090.1 PepS [Schleiferilactobacillus shenzhenensis LY-73]
MTYTLSDQLTRYADLIIHTGVAVKPGDTVVVTISSDQSELAEKIGSAAYAAGAVEVLTDWHNDALDRQKLLHAPDERLLTVPPMYADQIEYWLQHHAKRISVHSQAPNALAGVDPERAAAYRRALGTVGQPWRVAIQNNDIAWTVVAAASPQWAQTVFPQLSAAGATMKLWEAIFKTVRLGDDDYRGAWAAHIKKLAERTAWLNQQQFTELHYTSPRTDLHIGLPAHHVWMAGEAQTPAGDTFVPNMPTEEVFTAPDRTRINGRVTATKPLAYGGQLLTGMQFTFRDGQVVQATADQGNDVLQHLLATDAGARSLGEVALVPDQSSIAQSGILFYSTLFDENAASHLALGAAYPFSVAGGTQMDDAQLTAAGLNRSQVHVDFMVGSSDMSIDGLQADGTSVPVFRAGNWVR